MLKIPSKPKLSLIDRAFLLSVVVGPAASYSILYLFHVVLALKLTSTALLALAGRTFYIPRAIRWDIAFFLFFLSWYGLSIFWAQNTGYALRYLVYVSLAALTVFYTIRICTTLQRLKAAFRVLAAAFLIEIFFGILEGARIIRLPFSVFSPYQIYFGREPQSVDTLIPEIAQHALSMPTGFMGNPNNLAAFLVLILPFFLLNRRWGVKLAGAASILFIVYMAGARAAMIAYAVVVLLSVLFYASNLVRSATALFMLVVGGLAAGFNDAMKNSGIPQLDEVATIGVAVKDMVGGLVDDTAQVGMNSTGVRVQLIRNGLDALRASYGLGVGAGGSRTVQENSSVERLGEVGSMHNFWVELLVDGGIVFALVFAVWYLALLWRLKRTGRDSPVPLLRYCARSLLVGFCGFVLGAVGPSSVIYMLPMWMMIGVALATIKLDDQHKVTGNAGASRSSRPNLTNGTEV